MNVKVNYDSALQKNKFNVLQNNEDDDDWIDDLVNNLGN